VAAERLSMRCVKEVLRQKWVLKRTHRAVARSLGISSAAVSGLMARTAALGWTAWGVVEAMSEEALEERLSGSR
jgi:hypothetical protein